MRRNTLLLGFLLAAFAGHAGAATFIVSNSNDSGPGSLRQAILSANGLPGADEIAFTLPANAPAIQVLTPLPTITNAVTIGASRVAMIEISGALAPAGSRGLHVTAHDAWIEGIAVVGFTADASQNGGEGIVLEGGSSSIVTGCHIGINRRRSAVDSNQGHGLRIIDSSFNFISGNVITGNVLDGIRIEGDSDFNTLYGNLIGSFPGFVVSGNLGDGVAILSGHGNLLGTDGPCTICLQNQIAGNLGSGVYIGPGATATRVSGALIRYNVGYGVEIDGGQDSQIGGEILRNVGAGVYVTSGTGNTIRAEFPDSGVLGIDLVPLGIVGVTPNDPGDTDTGPNELQNFPILSAVQTDPGAVVTLIGALQSASNSPYVVDFYASDSCTQQGNGPGGRFFGSTNVATDGAGNANINVTFGPGLALLGPVVTATATDAAGNTSEFSPCLNAPVPVVTQIVPTSGPDTGGTPVQILGQNFPLGSTAEIGGGDAAAVVTPTTEIDGVSPALPPGTLNDVLVTDPDGQIGILPEGWLSDFLDVQDDHIFHDFVEIIFRAHVTAGCGFGLYCVDQPVPRDQMAVFLLVSSRTLSYIPPEPTGTVFLDVPTDAFAAAFIEALYDFGVTVGCGNNNYCPADPVTRAQMSVFLLRTLEGPQYFPPPCTTQPFSDVPCSSIYAIWIQEIAVRGITAGCGGGLFCPDASTTRGQMAVFLTETFGL